MALGTASFFALASLSDQQFMSWGWRVPFVASAVLVVIGIFVRLRIDETPAFKRVLREGNVARLPVLDTILHHPKDLMIGLGGSRSRTAGPETLLFASDIPHARPQRWRQPRLARWELPRRDPAGPRPNPPEVAARRRAARQRWPERQQR